MSAQTMTTEREDLRQVIDSLSDDRIILLAEHAKTLSGEQEIATLEAKYGTTPNAKTADAIREGRAGKVKSFSSVDALLADLRNDSED